MGLIWVLMMKIIKNRGNIDAVTEASIENQLENQPVLQFIFELADSDSILKIKATDLYLRFKTLKEKYISKSNNKKTSKVSKSKSNKLSTTKKKSISWLINCFIISHIFIFSKS